MGRIKILPTTALLATISEKIVCGVLPVAVFYASSRTSVEINNWDTIGSTAFFVVD
jgi:hypothetical protein